MMYKVILTLSFLVIPSTATAQAWREIVPLKSNCADVKRILSISTCLNTTYDFADAKVTIGFSDGTCATGWKVKNGTVLFVEVHPKAALKFQDLHLDETKYQKTVDSHLQDVTYYRNQEEGASIAVFSSGRVANLSFAPSSKHKELQCPDPVRPPRASIKFDEYESLSANEEEARLDHFVIQLMSWPESGGYVIAYGRQSKPREAEERAERVKKYLISRGVASDRISTVDGGYRERWTIELFVVIRE